MQHHMRFITKILYYFVLDIDECLNGTLCVNAQCFNNVGGFECECQPGYVFASGSLNVCENIDECEQLFHNCDQNCTDTDGSFTCKCEDGYSLDPNGFTCTAEPTTGKNQ